MRKPTHVMPILLSACLAGGLIGIAAQQDTEAEAEPTPAQVEQMVGLPDAIPAEAKGTPNPEAATKKSVDHGGLLFSSQCVMCHGSAGKGDGDLVARFKMKIPDLSDPAFQSRWTDGQLFYVLTHGHGRMPKQDRFDEKTRWDIVNYVRTLGK